jgi:histidyl-tRNA synthetase
MKKISAPKGMRDFYPDEYRVKQVLFRAWEEAARKFGFELYEAPVVETLELLERKAGEEISSQIYVLDKKGGQQLALRPELTPSLARMIIARQGELSFPLKWASIAQCFRYERMQKGRKREHYQLNLDIVGESSCMAEVEVLGAAVHAMHALGLNHTDFHIRIGSRSLLSVLFDSLGIAADHFTACCLALDKRDKISDVDVHKLLINENVSTGDIKKIFELLNIRSLEDVHRMLAGIEQAGPILDEITDFFELASDAGLRDYFSFDPGVIRGLGYYTGIVFEAFDRNHQSRAIFGGGRYDNLLSSLGGHNLPCVGLGFGDVVVTDLLKELGRCPGIQRFVDYAVGFMDIQCRPFASRVASRIRRSGLDCDLGLSGEKPKRFFSRGNRLNARKAVFIGPTEVETGLIQVKNMVDGRVRSLRLDESTDFKSVEVPG